MALSFSLTSKKFLQQATEGYALFVEQDFDANNLKELYKNFPLLPEYIKKQFFVGKAQSMLAMPCEQNGKLVYVMLLGLGAKKQKKLSIESYRRALACAIRCAKKNKLTTLAVQFPAAKLFGVSEEYLVQQTAVIAHMTDYVFDTFKEVAGGRMPLTLVLTGLGETKSLQRALAQGTIIAGAVNDARQWVNLPANIMHPDELASQARQIAKEYGLSCRVFSEPEIQKMGMGGLAAVSSGSEQDCCLVVLEYKTSKKNAPTIGFVGKGITFDSGGLDLKPASNMEIQKVDMSGAAAVIATMKALAQLKPDVNVIGIAPIAENLPSGVAAKPCDIVRMYNGKTVEIRNTDCEGRLILADALAYMVKNYKPAAIIDVATLTGACEHALGPFFTGLFTEHEDLKIRVEIAAQLSGDYVWPLPLTDDYKKAMEDTVADLSNLGNAKYKAGATTGAIFLQNFVKDTPWAHLDIAGTAFDVPDIAYYTRETATGVGVRLLTQLALDW